MPGSTAAPFASEGFRGRSANGPYGDSVEELDWSTGQILAALSRLELDAKTLVVWTSDNGAPRRDPPQGSNAPLKGWGYDTSEGAMRAPCILRWPGRIPAGTTCAELCTSMDLYVTFARLAGATVPDDRIIDGRDAWPLWSGAPGAASPYEAFYYYDRGDLRAVRSGPWKLYLPVTVPSDVEPGARPLRLYNLAEDVGEEHDAAREQPEVVARLRDLVAVARRDLGDGAQQGSGQRPAGHVGEPTPRTLPR
jgi:arylsulfatase A-like enzyme